MKGSAEKTLKALIRSEEIGIGPGLFVSIAKELADWTRKRHSREFALRELNPNDIHIRDVGGRPTLRFGSPDGAVRPSGQEDPLQAYAYVSPELTGRMKRPIDARSDLYVLGVIFYEMLTGTLPFAAASAEEWIHAHMAQLPVPPREANPKVPQVVSDLVMKLLSKTAEDRYQSAYGLGSDLAKCAERLADNGEIEPFPLGEVDEISRFSLPDGLYGRDSEIRELLDGHKRAVEGAKPFLLVGGHAGSGKTTLVKAARTRIAPGKGAFISGRFDQLNRSAPYASLIFAFRDLIRRILAGTDDEIASWRSRIAQALGNNAAVLTEAIDELVLIIGKQPPVGELPPAEATNRFHAVFGHFVQALANRNHPLTLWLDNLQWADAASLRLLRELKSDPSIRYFFFIGTYRNDEIDDGHLLWETILGEASEPNAAVRHLNVSSLGLTDVVRYFADALHAEPEEVKPLAEELYRKTAGNAFYLKQMLQLLYDEKLIRFDSDDVRWEWKLDEIRGREGFAGVIGLIEGRLKALPEETRQALRLASCIGSLFDLETLSRLYGHHMERTEQDLLPAVADGLVLTEGDRYTFLHDQVQKAAYDGMPAEEKKRVHLRLGRSLLRFYQSDATDDRLFDVTHHLNASSELMEDPAEIVRLASLNLQAGRKAKSTAAYARALELLDKGAGLIGTEGWTRYFELYSQLLLESSECLYFCGEFDRAEAVLEQLLSNVVRVADRAKIYVVRITMYDFQKKEKQACEVALKAMEEFGLPIPNQASRLSIMSQIARTQWRLWRNKHRLKDLPENDEPMQKALADIVMASASILYIVDAEKAVIVFSKYVRMALSQGRSEAFSIALGSYAITLAMGLKSYKNGLRLAEAALHYSEQTDSILLKGKLQVIVALILQFTRPKEMDRNFESAARLSLEGGDLIYAGYAISSRLIAGGNDLRHLYRLCASYAENAVRALDETTLRVLRITAQFVHLLENAQEMSRLSFNGEHFDEDELLRKEISSNQHKGNLYYYYTCKLEVYYLYGRYAEAEALAEESEHLYSSILLSIVQRHCFFRTLTMIALYPDAAEPSNRKYRKAIRKQLARMKGWTKLVPESTMAKYRILLAETARLDGKLEQAAKLYDEAIRSAQEHGEPRDEAIASELAAEFHLARGDRRKAEMLLRNACEAYFRWGAAGKVASLRENYPFLRSFSHEADDGNGADLNDAGLEAAATTDERQASGIDRELDMNTLRLASKLVYHGGNESWLQGFLNLAVRYVGAERGFVLLGRDGNWTVEAREDTNGSPENVPEGEVPYSEGVVQFVTRTREAVVIGEACQSLFSSDPYIQRNRTQSILCLPIRCPDNGDGVLYLENNLAADAFTADRLEVLEMAFSQMAYSKLRQRQTPSGDAKAEGARIAPAMVETLSNRELEILRLMAEGLSNKEVAARLDITEGTVKIHSSNIYGKLQVNRRVQAISKARELGLLD